MYIAKILITLRKTILDPQGKAVEHSLKSLGYDNVIDTRIGKYVELKIDSNDESSAKMIADEACKKLLANSVMEDYSFEIIKSEA
jgi:phosphoribosylformylglycinamidine synthase